MLLLLRQHTFRGTLVRIDQFEEHVQRSRMSFHLRVVMPSHPRFLVIVRAAVGEVGLVYGLPEESCRELIFAFDEAVAVNIAKK